MLLIYSNLNKKNCLYSTKSGIYYMIIKQELIVDQNTEITTKQEYNNSKSPCMGCLLYTMYIV